MRPLKILAPVVGIVIGLLAVACSSSETAAQPAQPAPAQQPEPVAAPAQQPQQPMAPAQPAPARPAAPAEMAPAPAQTVAEPIIPVARMVPASDADTNIFSEDRFGGTLIWVPQGSVGNLDSMTSGSAIGRGVSWHFWESLAQWDAQGFINPDMADSWEVDGGTYTFTLRDDLIWHDGTQVLPEDVGASIDRFRQQDKSFSPILNKIWQGFESVDDKTFKITLSEPSALLMTALGYVGGTQPNIMPMETANKYATGELIQDFVASGPYKFVSWDPGQRDNPRPLRRLRAEARGAELPRRRQARVLRQTAHEGDPRSGDAHRRRPDRHGRFPRRGFVRLLRRGAQQRRPSVRPHRHPPALSRT